jgi:23S rRNA (adenine2030-N6)-methyltransferase
MIASRMLRDIDAIRLCELHEPSAALLREAMGRDKRMKIEQRDGFEALPAYLPPPERRGLVLVDPPFEVALGQRKADFDWILKAARAAIRRWPQGVYVFWRPIKDVAAVQDFDGELASMLIEAGGIAPEKVLVADLWVRKIGEGPLSGAGVVIANAPFGVAEHLRAAMPWLCELMKQGEGAGWRVLAPAEGS